MIKGLLHKELLKEYLLAFMSTRNRVWAKSPPHQIMKSRGIHEDTDRRPELRVAVDCLHFVFLF